MAGKRVSAADMLGTHPKKSQAMEEPQPAKKEAETAPQQRDNASTSVLVASTSSVTYERATVYLRPGQRQWLEEVLDKEVRDASGKRIKSISASDIVRLAIDRLQGAVQEEGFPLLQELILAANKDAETFAGRKNRGIPKS